MSRGLGRVQVAIIEHLYDPEDGATVYDTGVFGVIRKQVNCPPDGMANPYPWTHWREPTETEWVAIRRAIRGLLAAGYVREFTAEPDVIGYRWPSGAPIIAAERCIALTAAGRNVRLPGVEYLDAADVPDQ